MTDENDHLKDRVPHDKSPSEGLQPTAALFWGLYLGVVFTLLVALVLSGEDVFSWTFWGGEEPDRSATLRNLGLVAIGVIGLPLAVWRGITAFQQAEAANKQADTANRQADLAEKGQIIDRYQKGAQMLESDELAVRMAGVFALRELAISEPGEMYVLVLDMLAAFIREKSKLREVDFSNISRKSPEPNYGPFPSDLQAALHAVSILRKNVVDAEFFEIDCGWSLNLIGANLYGADLSNTNLNNARLQNANCALARFSGSSLLEVTADKANFRNASFSKCIFKTAVFNVSVFSGADFFSAEFHNCTFFEADFTKAMLFNTRILNSDITCSVLDYANLSHSNIKSSNISYCSVSGTNFDNIIFDDETKMSDIRFDFPPIKMPSSFYKA